MGRRVIHSSFGAGEVLVSQHGGYRLLVRFEDGSSRWIRIDELAGRGQGSRSAGPGSAGPPPSAPEPPSDADPKHRARAMIEAFKLGIVPYGQTSDFTFGRDVELGEVTRWLQEERETSLVMVGEYGAGKTHMIESIIQRGLESGYAVARVELDPSERPLHKPKRVYARLVETLRWRSPGSARNETFRPFIEAIADSGGLDDHIYLTHATNGNQRPAFWEWLEAREPAPRPWTPPWFAAQAYPQMFDYQNAGNIYCYLLSAFGWAAIELLNLKGLLLVFDEAEAVEFGYTAYQQQRGLDFLTALLRCEANEPALTDPRGCDDLAHTTMGIGRSVPFAYRLPTGLRLAFAFTSLAWNEQEMWDGRTAFLIPELAPATTLPLEPLSSAAMLQAIAHIEQIYRTAFDGQPGQQLDPALLVNGRGSHNTRSCMKTTVEVLDLLRHHPDLTAARLLR